MIWWRNSHRRRLNRSLVPHQRKVLSRQWTWNGETKPWLGMFILQAYCVVTRSALILFCSHNSSPPMKVVNVHPPAKSAPVCSDPSSLKRQASNVPSNLKEMQNEEIAALVLQDKIKDHQLEKLLDPHRAVEVRRLKFDAKLESLGNGGALNDLPHKHDLDYKRVLGANCEIVVGYVPIPVGLAGPITLNGESVYIPMATTEGCLVASTNRGCKAITQGSGAFSAILKDGITRAPCCRLPSAQQAAEVAIWIETPDNFAELKRAFESTTSFGKLLEARPTVAGRNVYIRLKCFAGDAMGMNMISKGSLAVIECLRSIFPDLSLLALSGNVCTDKKAAAMNWIEGRGKSVVIEATIPKDVVSKTLKTSVKAIVEANINKNLIGSAMASVVGGFNAHAANNVTAVFLATGQGERCRHLSRLQNVIIRPLAHPYLIRHRPCPECRKLELHYYHGGDI